MLGTEGKTAPLGRNPLLADAGLSPREITCPAVTSERARFSAREIAADLGGKESAPGRLRCRGITVAPDGRVQWPTGPTAASGL